MALIKCPECGAAISPHAQSCPACGEPMTRGSQGSPAAYTRAACLIVLAVVIIMAVVERERIADAWHAYQQKRATEKILEP